MENLMTIAFETAGGLAIFLLGINFFSESLKKMSSHSVKRFLEKVTSSPLSGTLVGLAVTALIQSSSATTVLTVGFVNSGLMTFSQAIGIVYGANIGTTVTAQIMAFNLSSIALPVLMVGVVLMMFFNKDLIKNIGTFFVGFGLLFYGMLMMTEAVAPLKNSPKIINIFLQFADKPIRGVLAGILVTFVIQSSSATVGLVLALMQANLVDINGAIPLILGNNIGTCITALLASLNSNMAAKRVVAAHFGFNIIGTIIVLILLDPFKHFVNFFTKYVTLTSDPVRQAANAHTLFNVLNTMLFLPLTKYYTALIEWLFKGKEDAKPKRAIFLDKNLLKSPFIAIEAIIKEINRGLDLSVESLLTLSEHLLNKPNKQKLEVLLENESIMDTQQYEITNYITLLATYEMGEKVAASIPEVLHATNDLERIGDHQQNLYNIYKRQIGSRVNLPEKNLHKLVDMIDVIIEFTKFIQVNLKEDKLIDLSIAHNFESRINELRDSCQQDYFHILQEYKDVPFLSTIVYDYILNLEKIGDHLTNISEHLSLVSEF